MSTTIANPMTFHTILIIKITFTFGRTFWRTHSVLHLTILMTIILSLSHAHTHCKIIITIVIFQSYHVLLSQLYDRMEQINWHILNLSFTAITFFLGNRANLMIWISRFFIKNKLFFLRHHIIITMLNWLKHNILHI